MAQVLKLSKHTYSGIVPPTKPHLLNLPSSTINWGSSVQMPKTMGEHFIQTTTLGKYSTTTYMPVYEDNFILSH